MTFWKNQPVPQTRNELEETNGLIREAVNISKNPCKLPVGMYWVSLDLTNETTLNEIYILLKNNYVADANETVRFDYSKDFLKWALSSPNLTLICGIKQFGNSNLISIITGTQEITKCKDVHVKVLAINFLCVHKNFRLHGITPLMIQEITRQANLHNILVATYTSGTFLPTPICTTKYWHRTLNSKNLLDFDFIPKLNLQELIKKMKLPSKVSTNGWRSIQITDSKQVCELLNKSKYKLQRIFETQDIEYLFKNIPKVISSYVVENNGIITDFGSFYQVSLHNLNKQNIISISYCYYYAHTTISLETLIQNLLIESNNQKCDVFNCLDIMDNVSFFENLKFDIGTGNLNYYLYNYGLGKCNPNDVGVIFL